MSRPALDALAQFGEVNLFLRGIVPMVGFKSGIVEYERHERFAGQSKYPLGKMLSFAFDGITSFSTMPIRLITLAGFGIFVVSLLALLIFLVQKLLGYTVQGWATLMGSIWLIGGLQLLALGILGEYIGKIYMEVKHRPRFGDRTGAGRFSGRRRNTAGRPERLEITTAGTVRRDMIA